METPSQIITGLCQLFNASHASFHYLPQRQEWMVNIEGAYRCYDTGNTRQTAGGGTEKIISIGAPLSASGQTIDQAAEELQRMTVSSGRRFLLTNQGFYHDILHEEDTRPAMITVYEGTDAIEKFPFDREKIVTLVQKYG